MRTEMRIKILLIADNAEHLSLDCIPDLACALDRDGREIREYFDLSWVATPQECRVYYDLTSLIDAKNDKQIISELPDIILMDYALTTNEMAFDVIHNLVDSSSESLSEIQTNCRPFAIPVEVFLGLKRPENLEIVDKISPLPSLRKLAEESSVPESEIEKTRFTEHELHPLPEEANYVVHDRASASNNCVDYQHDHMGALAGLAIYDRFSSRYPVSLVAHTAMTKKNVANTPTAFLEYLHERDAGETFKNKGNKANSWKRLIHEGVRTYRKRAVELALNDCVSFALDGLLTLADENARLPQTIRIKSAFGEKELPLNGLFVDYENVVERRQAAREWAKEILQGLCRVQPNGLTENQLVQARQISCELFERYCSQGYRKLRRERNKLSRLIADVFDYFKGADLHDTDDYWNSVRTEVDKQAQEINVEIPYLQVCVSNEIERQSRADGRKIDDYRDRFNRLFELPCADVPNVRNAVPPCIAGSYTIINCGCRDGIVLRLATLFTYARLLVLLLQFIRKTNNGERRVRKFANEKSFASLMSGASFDSCLLYDALFPLPATPLVLPWEKRGTGDPAGAWNINRFFGRDNAVSIRDLAQGNVDVLRPGELFILDSFFAGLSTEYAVERGGEE